MEFWLFLIAVVLGLLSALSLLAKAEALRGSGRIAGGLSTLLLGLFLLLVLNQHSAVYQLLSAGVVLCGLVTVGSGVRKYMRRNSQ
jgi:hypothetical protein